MALTVLDAGVVIALGDTSDARHSATQPLVRQARDAGDQLCVPASAFAEALVGPIRLLGEAEGRRRVQRLLDLLSVDVVGLDADIAVHAAALRARYGSRLCLPDALVVATAVERKGAVLTTDSAWPSIPGVRIRVVR